MCIGFIGPQPLEGGWEKPAPYGSGRCAPQYPFEECSKQLPYGTSTIFTALITTGVFGRSFRSHATAAILATTSWPFTT